MPWSGKDPLLTEFLPQFHEPKLCHASLDRYVSTARVLDDDRARKWLQRDLLRDQELAAIADPEDYALGPSRYDLNGCYHCHGRGYVRLDVDKYAPEFGKAKPCPACSTRPGDAATHCAKCADFSANGSGRNRCSKCGQFEDEPAGERCGHAQWHWPNWQAPPGLSVDTVLKRF